MGQPLNEKGGGVFALEWDPINKHIRSWVFTPHSKVPSNLRDALLTANNDPDQRVAPNTQEWGLPYGYFAIGKLRQYFHLFRNYYFFNIMFYLLCCRSDAFCLQAKAPIAPHRISRICESFSILLFAEV